MKLYAGCESSTATIATDVCSGGHRHLDTMSASVKYSNSGHDVYSLNAFMPFEGYRIAFNGDRRGGWRCATTRRSPGRWQERPRST